MASDSPMIIFYNAQCAKPGYQRMPAAILQVASFIEDIFPYEIVDANLDQQTDHAGYVIEQVQKHQLRYIAFSVMPGPQLASTVRDLRRIKAACPEVVTIFGGYFPLNHYQTCARDADVDYVIVGPGERAFRELIECLEAGESPASVRGVAYCQDGVLAAEGGEAPVLFEHKQLPVEPDQLPRYPYHRLDVERYVVPTFLGQRTLSHHSSFGCPFMCNFCAVVSLAKGQWKGECSQRLGDLAEHMVHTWQIDALEFHDNNFFTSEKRVAGFCKELLARKLQLNWWGEGRPDTLLKYSDETWALMREAGLKMIFLGAESGSDDTLKQMNKGGTQSSNGILSLVEKMKTFDVVPELSFILGNPPHPAQDMRQTINFIRKVKKVNPATEIIMYRYDPVPLGGELFEEVTRQGFEFPTSLDEWVGDRWRKIQKRTSADVPWLDDSDQQYLADFQTVLNAQYPTSTMRHIKPGSWQFYLLKAVSGVRYHLGLYARPVELKWLQRVMAYQRPEISGF